MRFNGFGYTLDYRPHETKWCYPYRLRVLPNKQERKDFRITVFGDTEQSVFEEAEDKIKELNNA